MKTGLHRRAGAAAAAGAGVLFLDEIGDMPLALQSRLLRVLQEREVSPLAARPVPVDFALLCATHRPLAHEARTRRCGRTCISALPNTR